MKALTAIAMLCAWGALSCDKDDPPQDPAALDARSSPATTDSAGAPRLAHAEKKTKFEVQWIEERKFQVKGDPTLSGDVTIHRGTYQVTLRKFPKGTYWKSGSDEGIFKSTVLHIAKIKDMTPEFGAIPIDKITDRSAELDPKATLEVVIPDGRYTEIKLPPSKLVLSVEQTLQKAENGPVRYGDEPLEDAKPGTSIAWVHAASMKVFGQATVLSDIDAVALPRLLDEVKGTKTCSGYKSNDGKPMADIEVQLKETEVVVYDRRKGGELFKKTFPPAKDCPTFAFTKAGQNKMSSSIPTKPIESWLRSKAK